MKRSLICASVVGGALALSGLSVIGLAAGPDDDFGAFVEISCARTPSSCSASREPLRGRARGPVRRPRQPAGHPGRPRPAVSLVSSSVASAADQIALWPNDDHPTHLFVCDEETSNPAVQRVDLSAPPSRTPRRS